MTLKTIYITYINLILQGPAAGRKRVSETFRLSCILIKFKIKFLFLPIPNA